MRRTRSRRCNGPVYEPASDRPAFAVVEIVKRSDAAKGFVVLLRRWVVERTFAWLGRCRRLAKDWEKSLESATAFAHIASIRMLTRRIARHRS